MRIALVAEQVDRRKGGAETSVGEFATHVAGAGMKVCCLTCGGSASKDGNIEIRPVFSGTGPRWWRYKKYLESAAKVAGCGTFDIVHAIVPCAAADIYQPRGGTVPETQARNLALVGPGLRGSFKRFLQQATLKQRVMAAAEHHLLTKPTPPVVACLSQYVVQQVQNHYGLSGPNVRVIFNGVDPDPSDDAKKQQDRIALRSQWNVDEHQVVFVTVAHNFKLKGVHRLLHAAALASRKGQPLTLVVAGKDTDVPYRRLAKQLGIADRVHFVGPVADVWALYHAADACVLNSYYDPCSRVILEALGAGLPCVTTRYNGASDVIADGENGYVIASPDDVAGLSDRMTLLLDRGRRVRLGQSARLLRSEVSMTRHAHEMLVLYEQVAKEKNSRV